MILLFAGPYHDGRVVVQVQNISQVSSFTFRAGRAYFSLLPLRCEMPPLLQYSRSTEVEIASDGSLLTTQEITPRRTPRGNTPFPDTPRPAPAVYRGRRRLAEMAVNPYYYDPNSARDDGYEDVDVDAVTDTDESLDLATKKKKKKTKVAVVLPRRSPPPPPSTQVDDAEMNGVEVPVSAIPEASEEEEDKENKTSDESAITSSILDAMQDPAAPAAVPVADNDQDPDNIHPSGATTTITPMEPAAVYPDLLATEQEAMEAAAGALLDLTSNRPMAGGAAKEEKEDLK